MTTTTDPHHKRLVRPRWVWAGLLVALVGAAVLGVGVAVGSWTWSIIGAVVLAVGSVASLRGGVMNDVHRKAPGQEVGEVLHGDVHEGIAPGDRLHDAEAEQTSRELDRHREALIRATHQAPRPALAPLGGVVLLIVAVFLLAAQWAIYPIGSMSQNNAIRSLAVAIVAGMAGLRILVGLPGAHRVATALALLAGIVLVVNAALSDHEIWDTAVIEATSGVLVALSALVAMLSPLPSQPLDTRPQL